MKASRKSGTRPAAASKRKANPKEVEAESEPRGEPAEQVSRPKVVSKAKSALELGPDHPNWKTASAGFMKAFGTTDMDFINGLLKQALVASGGGRDNEERLKFMIAVIKGIKPRDQIEALLASQMAGVHTAAMIMLRNFADAKYVEQRDSAERTLNKLMRTFTGQMETLKRYRTGGEQTVTVQHVTVREGGQAIVGNVTQGRRVPVPDRAVASPLAISDAKTAPMPTIENKKQAPVPKPRLLKKR